MTTVVRITTAVLISVLLICSTGCAATKTDGNSSQDEALQILSHSMTVHKFSGDMLQSTVTVKGKAENISDFTLSSASIAVKFYDADGKLIDNSSAVTQNLGAGGIWDFTVQSSGPDAWKIVNYDITASSNQ